MRSIILSAVFLGAVLVFVPSASADISGFTSNERADVALIQETISQTPDLARLSTFRPEIATIFAIRLIDLKRVTGQNRPAQSRTLKENPEAILDLMKLIRLAAEEGKK